MQTIWLQPVDETKREKLRLHLDLRPDGRRCRARGASGWSASAPARADVGQTGEEGFTVLADPEGNEFCVLHRDPR